MARDRDEAQQRRAEARSRRRGQTAKNGEAREQGGEHDETLEGVKHAAKVAATAAAVGAAVGAARALTGRGDGGEHEDDASAGGDERHEPGEAEQEQPRDAQEASVAEEQRESAEQQQEDDEGDRADDRTPQADREPQPVAERGERDESAERDERRDGKVEGADAAEASRVAEEARAQLRELRGAEPEAVSGLERTQEGWIVQLEVVEVARIPESTDVLATYEVVLDSERRLVRYSRGRRYHRSQADPEG